MRKFLICFLGLPLLNVAQFAPPVGQVGTTAIYKDSSAFINWATFCNVSRGLKDISNAGSGYASLGDSSKAIGIADNSVVSLGDGGTAVCTFQYPVTDGPGPDFAIFENSFSDDYLEFGFVEVSSDGINFFRFPATCNIQDTAQCGSFGLSDATLVNNLAGKYRALYGTPFDLQELQGTAGLNINNITHVKIVDVVGSISAMYATYDKNNNKVNDPWPTVFPSCGFDLDAVGVIHDITNSVSENSEAAFVLYPNPAKDLIHVSGLAGNYGLRLMDLMGNEIQKMNTIGRIDVSALKAGIYFVEVRSGEKSVTQKVIITE